ncbi:MAG: hypothetical protein KatS3mg111_2480 [Pirellulaceae bacterium]|nr:MAG: hypothetical protein KatS3mg111_2480 [Pirellulaceae bacterium]
MIKDLVSALQLSTCAEVALSLFVISFAMIVYGAFRLSRRCAEHCATIPLEDEPVKELTHE